MCAGPGRARPESTQPSCPPSPVAPSAPETEAVGAGGPRSWCTRSIPTPVSTSVRLTTATAKRARRAKRGYGYEATLAVAAREADGPDFPSVVVGMAVLHRPGVEPGQNGVRALDSVRRRGHPANWLAADRAYSSAKAQDFQLPVRSLGYRPVYDYKADQLGVKASTGGFNQVEGCWYCPMMPASLVNATADHRAKRIDDDVYTVRLAEREHYRARPKTRPNEHGDVRSCVLPQERTPSCAASSSPARSPGLRPAARASSLTTTSATTRRRVVAQEIGDDLPRGGRKVRPGAPLREPGVEATYNRLRNATEGDQRFLEGPGPRGAGRTPVDGGSTGWRLRVSSSRSSCSRPTCGGSAASWSSAAIANGKLSRLRPPRRRAKALSDWLPQGTSLEGGHGPGPPSSG